MKRYIRSFEMTRPGVTVSLVMRDIDEGIKKLRKAKTDAATDEQEGAIDSAIVFLEKALEVLEG